MSHGTRLKWCQPVRGPKGSAAKMCDEALTSRGCERVRPPVTPHIGWRCAGYGNQRSYTCSTALNLHRRPAITRPAVWYVA